MAKERQAAEANRNATSLLEQLAQEDAIQKQRQCLAAKKRDKKKKKRQSRQQKDEDESGEDGTCGGGEDWELPGRYPVRVGRTTTYTCQCVCVWGGCDWTSWGKGMF